MVALLEEDHVADPGGAAGKLLFVGAAQTALVAPAFLTLTSEQAVEAARILGEPKIIPLHFEGWTHYTEGSDMLRQAFAHAELEARLHILVPGEQIEPELHY